MRFTGTILGFNYDIELKNEEEFEIWLEAKLKRYVLQPNTPATRVVEKILGITELKEVIHNAKRQ